VHDGVTGDPLAGPAGGDGDEFLRAAESPDAILLIVAGARNAGMTTVLPMIRPMFHSREIGAGG
jgi:hypothetical protein